MGRAALVPQPALERERLGRRRRRHPNDARGERRRRLPPSVGESLLPVGTNETEIRPGLFSLGIVLLMASGITLMYGSVGSWVKVTGSVGGATVFHASINGIDPGISTLIGLNGYVTFIGGIVLLTFAGLAMTNDDALLAILTALVSAAILVFAVYDMFRIVQKLSQVTTPAGRA